MLKDILPGFLRPGVLVVMTLNLPCNGEVGSYIVKGTVRMVCEHGVLVDEGDGDLAFICWPVIGIIRPAGREAVPE